MKKAKFTRHLLTLFVLFAAASLLTVATGCCKHYVNPDDKPLITVRNDYRSVTKFKRTKNTPHSISLQK